MIGMKFHRLTVLERGGRTKHDIKFLCRCECGAMKEVAGRALRSGNTRSCGCLKRETNAKLRTEHGLAAIRDHDGRKHPLYLVWRGIKTRCYNPRCKAFKTYGRRGIKLAEEWLNDPQSFVRWCLANGWKPGLTIDRYPNADGNYEPGNCRFVTKSENTRHLGEVNRRRRIAEMIGGTLSLPC